MGRQTSRNLKSPPSWDTGWNIHFVLRKVLAGNRIKKENLRSELNPGNLSDTRIPASKRAIRSSKSSLNSQSNREPAGTEEGNQIKDLKTSSAPPSLPATVLILEVAVVATKTQNLYRVIETHQNVYKNSQGIYKINKNVSKIKLKKSNRALETKRDHDNKEIHCDNKRKTYREEKEICATEHNPENETQTVNTGISDRPKRDRDKNGKTYWATASPRLTPSSQESRNPNNTEEGNRIENPKASSVLQDSPGTMQALEIAIITTRIQKLSRDIGTPVSNIAIVAMRSQELLRDIGVPIPISQRMYNVNQNKFESKKAIRAVGSPARRSRLDWPRSGPVPDRSLFWRP